MTQTVVAVRDAVTQYVPGATLHAKITSLIKTNSTTDDILHSKILTHRHAKIRLTANTIQRQSLAKDEVFRRRRKVASFIN